MLSAEAVKALTVQKISKNLKQILEHHPYEYDIRWSNGAIGKIWLYVPSAKITIISAHSLRHIYEGNI